MVPHLGGIVESRRRICRAGCFPDDLIEWLPRARGAREEFVQVIHVSLVMLTVMEAQGSGGEMRRQRVLGVRQRRQLNPGLEFRQGNMLALDIEDGAWAGIVAFYSIIHIPRDEVVTALHELKRVLQPGGWLLVAFHLGTEVLHLEEWWEQPVSADFVYFQAPEMQAYVQAAGFLVEDLMERPPYPEVEYQSHRAYILARKPA